MSAKIFRTDRALRFGDCDISGTAYFPSYLDILNGVNEEFWAYLGYPWHKIIWNDRWGTPTVHLSCDFSKPSFSEKHCLLNLALCGLVDHLLPCGTGSAAAQRSDGQALRSLLRVTLTNIHPFLGLKM